MWKILRRIVLWHGRVNVSFGCRVDTRVIAFPASPPPLPGFSCLSGLRPNTNIFSNSSDNIWQISIISEEINGKATSTEEQFPEKICLSLCWHILSLVNQKTQFRNCPSKNKLIRLRQKICQSSNSSSQNTCYVHSSIHTFSERRVMKNTWAVCEGLFSKQFSDPRQGSVDCS